MAPQTRTLPFHADFPHSVSCGFGIGQGFQAQHGATPIADGLQHGRIDRDGSDGRRCSPHLAVIVARAGTWDAMLRADRGAGGVTFGQRHACGFADRFRPRRFRALRCGTAGGDTAEGGDLGPVLIGDRAEKPVDVSGIRPPARTWCPVRAAERLYRSPWSSTAAVNRRPRR